MRVEVVRWMDGAHLARRVWVFSTQELMGSQGGIPVGLEHYTEGSRETRRHKFRPSRSWSRLGHSGAIDTALVPLPEDVVEEALGRFRAGVYQRRLLP